LAPILNTYSVRSAAQEGFRKITTIEFTGNKSFRPTVLANALRLVKDGKPAAQDMVDYDVEVNLKTLLEENGYLQCEVSGQLVSLNAKEAKLEIHVSEGPQYRIEALNVHGVEPFSKEEIYAQFQLNPGEIANRTKINNGLKRISQMFDERGYIYLDYIADQNRDPVRGTVSLIFTFLPGIQYRIVYVGFVGCDSQAQEDRLRQSVSIQPGDIYTNSKLEETRTAIDRTGLFRKIAEEDYTIYPVKEGFLGIVFWLTPRK
jgi:outer membrane protein insertion porin family